MSNCWSMETSFNHKLRKFTELAGARAEPALHLTLGPNTWAQVSCWGKTTWLPPALENPVMEVTTRNSSLSQKNLQESKLWDAWRGLVVIIRLWRGRIVQRPELCVRRLVLGRRSGWPLEVPMLPPTPGLALVFLLVKTEEFWFYGYKKYITPMFLPSSNSQWFPQAVFPKLFLTSIHYKKACTHICIIRSAICNFEISRALKIGKFLMFDSKTHGGTNPAVNYLKAIYTLYLLYLVWIFICFTAQTSVCLITGGCPGPCTESYVIGSICTILSFWN